MNSTRPTFPVLAQVGLVEFTGRGTDTRPAIPTVDSIMTAVGALTWYRVWR